MTHSDDTHDDVIRRAIDGEDRALGELVALYHDRVYRYGKAVCRDVDVDDAVQEAFLALTKSRHKLNADNGIASWLFVTVRNACRQMLRPLARRRRLLGHQVSEDTLDESAAPDDTPETAALRSELVHEVHAALLRLDAKHREVLVLRDLEGRSGEWTAEHLGLSLAAMKSRLHLARKALRDELT